MLVCAGASVCVCVRACVGACVRVFALRIVSSDKILRFKNTLIIILSDTQRARRGRWTSAFCWTPVPARAEATFRSR